MTDNYQPIDREIGPERIDTVDEREERPLPLMHLLASPARKKLVEYFLDEADDRPKSKSEIARETDSSRTTVIKHIDDLVRFGLVRTEGEERLRYAPAVESNTYQLLQKTNNALFEAYTQSAVPIE